MRLLVLPHARAVGWPLDADAQRQPEPCQAVELRQALTQAWATDAHFTCYEPFLSAPFRWRRSAFHHSWQGWAPLRLGLVAFDCDDPEAHRTGEPASASWRHEFDLGCGRLPPGAWHWHTRGGGRVLFSRAPADEVFTAADAEAHAVSYLAWCEFLRASTGLVADPSCADVGRLFRLPHATRRPGADPDWFGPVRGLERDLGVWSPWASAADPIAAPWYARVRRRRLGVGGPPAPDADAGVLLWLLRQRGWLGRELGGGKWSCWCPSQSHGKAESDTIVWPNGRLHCSHNRCQGWLASEAGVWQWFGLDEVRAALLATTGVTPCNT